MYNLAQIGVRDHFGDAINDGFGDIIMSTAPGNNVPCERMRLTYAGDVGIGTSSPSCKLDVNGTMSANLIITRGLAVTSGPGYSISNTPLSIDTNQLLDASVTSSKLALEAVTTDNIANCAINTYKLANLSVTTGKLQNGSVTSIKLDEDLSISNSVTAQYTTASKVLTAKDKFVQAEEVITNTKCSVYCHSSDVFYKVTGYQRINGAPMASLITTINSIDDFTMRLYDIDRNQLLGSGTFSKAESQTYVLALSNDDDARSPLNVEVHCKGTTSNQYISFERLVVRFNV